MSRIREYHKFLWMFNQQVSHGTKQDQLEQSNSETTTKPYWLEFYHFIW